MPGVSKVVMHSHTVYNPLGHPVFVLQHEGWSEEPHEHDPEFMRSLMGNIDPSRVPTRFAIGVEPNPPRVDPKEAARMWEETENG